MRALLPTLALAALACSSTGATPNRCQTDDACGDGNACAAGTCLPRAAPPASWSIELAPRSDSAAALTELTNVAMPAATFDLTAMPKVTLTGTLSFDTNATPLSTAHVVLSVPSRIAGLPDLQFETDLAAPTKTATPAFTLPIPSDILMRPGSLRLLPGAPDNATHAPSIFAVTVAPTLALPIASKSLTVSGRLLSALGTPLENLVARAFANGSLVSNVVATTKDGFTLTVPADAAYAPSLAVEVEAKPTDAPQPHFWAKPFALTANKDLGDVQLPAYVQPNTFQFPFQGEAAGDPAVVGALVRARTLLADDMTGTTDYLYDGMTDMTGQASLSLIPGTTTMLRLYDIAVVPPAGSVYATTCLEKFGLAAGIVQQAVTIPPRPVFAGSITGADGSPVSGVVIVASRTAAAAPTACDAFASAPQVTGTTTTNGTFMLWLDAGTYTLDYDPPAGAAYPRLTETAVVVDASGAPHDVQLPPGAVVEGTLRDAAGQPLPQASVRFYGPACAAPNTMRCAGAPPLLEAQARSDANGHYRTVIPAAQ